MDSNEESNRSRQDDSWEGSVRWRAVFQALPWGGRAIGAVLLVGIGGYALLFGIDWATESPVDRLAAVEVSDQMIESYYSPEARQATSAADTTTVEDVYLRSLRTLRRAESSTLGLFRRYDADSLHRAVKGLQRVLDRTEARSFLAQEAQFYLGKAYLAQRRPDAARGHFEVVVEQEGRRVQEARRILEALRALGKDSGSEPAS